MKFIRLNDLKRFRISCPTAASSSV